MHFAWSRRKKFLFSFSKKKRNFLLQTNRSSFSEKRFCLLIRSKLKIILSHIFIALCLCILKMGTLNGWAQYIARFIRMGAFKRSHKPNAKSSGDVSLYVKRIASEKKDGDTRNRKQLNKHDHSNRQILLVYISIAKLLRKFVISHQSYIFHWDKF